MPKKKEEEKENEEEKEQEVSPKFSKIGVTDQVEKRINQLSKETEDLVSSFKEHFEKCTKACKKPNILLGGITGTGKSTLCNAVFGKELAKSGVGLPITQHFQKYEPKSKPIVIYDSKGLEWSEAKSFIKETGKFFTDLRHKPDVAEHIHCVWYVINTARGRFEDFEAELISKVFNPTPVIFVLNKADLADCKQIIALKKVIESYKFPNNKGVFVTISKRKTWAQTWCSECFKNDVFFDEETKELECVECGNTEILKDSFGLQSIVSHTVDILPELSKDAFMYSQETSLSEKDKRAKQKVKDAIRKISLDYSGGFIKEVSEMCAKMFVIWGWPLTGDTFKEGLASIQKEYVTSLKFRDRFLAATLDKMFGSILSKSLAAIVGLSMNRGMKKLNKTLIEHVEKGDIDKLEIEDLLDPNEVNDVFLQAFFETALLKGVEIAIERYWDISNEELKKLASEVKISEISESAIGSGLFGNITPEDIAKMDNNELSALGIDNININEIDIDNFNSNLNKEKEKEQNKLKQEKKKVQKKKEEEEEEEDEDEDEDEVDID